MKLYTEEQVLKIIQKTIMDKPETYYEVLKYYIPIELPSDDEIDEESPYIPNDSKIDYLSHQEGFIKGAKWMKEQILNQNK